MLLADRLRIPQDTAALLFDMDGVIFDSLRLDYEIVERLAQNEFGSVIEIPREVIRAYFPMTIPDFWWKISETCSLELTAEGVSRLTDEHEKWRRDSVMTVHAGIAEIMNAARASGLAIAVVSNNPRVEILTALARADLNVDEVIGNDQPGVRKKPAPDMYREATRCLGLQPCVCVAIEDSLLGTQASHEAGCYTIAVATGANSFDELSTSPYVSACYESFAIPHPRTARA